MYYKTIYASPLGNIFILSNEKQVVGVWFEGKSSCFSKHFEQAIEQQNTILRLATDWLQCYFQGKEPSFSLPLQLSGTPYQQDVWEQIATIPYGATTTYQAIAKAVAKKQGKTTYSTQAAGNAIGQNPIAIIIPCHRIIGSNGKLTGYNGGLARKAALLQIEQQKEK